jgi:hypothetical protein
VGSGRCSISMARVRPLANVPCLRRKNGPLPLVGSRRSVLLAIEDASVGKECALVPFSARPTVFHGSARLVTGGTGSPGRNCVGALQPSIVLLRCTRSHANAVCFGSTDALVGGPCLQTSLASPLSRVEERTRSLSTHVFRHACLSHPISSHRARKAGSCAASTTAHRYPLGLRGDRTA